MTDTATIERPMPTNVIQAIARVESEIGGIAKLTPAQRAARNMGSTDAGITYAYRSIDQVAAEAQPLFGVYGVVIVPVVMDSEVVSISKGSNSNWTRTTVTVRWDVYGPGGTNDVINATTVGVGDDNSDKGMNKAMTAAFKNLLLRILCIGDPADDPDSARHDYDDQAQTPADVGDWQEAIAKITPPQRLALMKHGATLGVKSIGVPGDQVAAMRRALNNILAGREAHEDAPPPEAPAPAELERMGVPEAVEDASPEPAKPRARGRGQEQVANPPAAPVATSEATPPPGEPVHNHPNDCTFTNETCTVCGKSEPF